MGGLNIMNKIDEFLNHADYQEVDLSYELENTNIEKLKETILNKQDCILFGPPGTSKTYMLNYLKNENDTEIGEIEIIQFHANYTYEDFIEGLVPDEDQGGFKYKDGTFLNFCKKAQEVENKDKICIFVIDEINRADVIAVFGEVLFLMEDKGTRKIITSKKNEEFMIPSNVVIVGTMNTADKALSKLDFAFRRRFKFLAVNPSSEILYTLLNKNGFEESNRISVSDYVKCFEVLNAKINKHQLLGKNLMLGHILWIKKDSNDSPYSESDLSEIFRETILPQLENYIGSNYDVLATLIGPQLCEKIRYGYKILDNEIIDLLSSLKNSEANELL